MSSLMDSGRAKDTILEEIAAGSTLKDACAKAGVTSGTHYVWKANDPAYEAAWRFALTIRADRLEEVAEARAVQGYEETTVYYEHGEETGRKTVHKYSDALLQMLLKASNPEKFKDRVQQEIAGDVELLETLTAARKRIAPKAGNE